ncbi:hypothetical protein JN11_02861 [Mucilaginibacter frigoritolerans]|uniref:PH (Pleckstrin Homology) domain-containing protein n=1 Tax=Mucilaginibacter frigoritolerans TaxID=652788 RepID=A0A562TYX8_9SPHI|nr:hypothetical protein [Mucilaginibacter frigoritolerans]TWI98673.1 hypothetical protein JN11_02861 [Mucilaginibacter frigoritolerans]
MDESVISKFYIPSFFYAICGAIFLLGLTIYMLYHCLLGNLLYPGKAYTITLFLCGALGVYYYFVSKSWKRITVTASEIVVYNLISKKQITITYADITHISTYRTQGGRRGLSSQRFIIDIKDDRSLEINESWYENYNKLTMAIYHHKYGPGHGRERYLERHQNQT